jgi:hypothetical protein
MPDDAPALRLSDARLLGLREDVANPEWRGFNRLDVVDVIDDLRDARRECARLRAERDAARAEIARVAPYLAVHGVLGYRVEIIDTPPLPDDPPP